ncbi:hypothetical protein ABZV94_35020, partial [Streptomyces sp. NPDC004658]
ATDVARLLGAGIATTALARDALPYLTGVAGPPGSEAAATLLRERDTGAEDLDVGSVWADVLARRGPVLLEFVVDGETPPGWSVAVDAARNPGRGGPGNPLAKLSRVPG